MKNHTPINNITRALSILLPCAILHSVGMDIFVSGVPAMIHALHTTEQSIQYLLIFFMVGTGVGQPLAGVLCDVIGRRRVMLGAAILFVMASLAATQMTSIPLLTLCRFLAGLGACGTLVSTYTVVNDTFHRLQAYRMFSFIAGTLSFAPMLAPVVGVSLMSIFGGWQACFYFLSLMGLMSFLVAYRYLPETRPVDLPKTTIRSFAKNYRDMFQHRCFLVYTLAATLALTQLYLYFSVGNILLINVMGLSPYRFSWAFAFNGLLFLAGNFLSTRMQRQMDIHTLVLGGVSCMLFGAMLMAYLGKVNATASGVIIANSIMTFAVGIIIGPATGAALQPFKQFAGVASGLFAVMQYAGSAFIGYIVTRFTIHSPNSIAVPLALLSLLTCIMLVKYRDDAKITLSAEYE